VFDSDNIEDDTLNDKDLIPKDNEHYVWMEKVFVFDHWWTWIINLITYITVIVIYFTLKGEEIVFAIYLPLDLLLNISKAAYYFLAYYYNYDRDKRD